MSASKAASSAASKAASRLRRIARIDALKAAVKDGPSLQQFAGGSTEPVELHTPSQSDIAMRMSNEGKQYYLETYGCQMNVSDTEIVASVLVGAGYTPTQEMGEADVIFVNTCAVRENAESKVWQRLDKFRSVKRQRAKRDRPVVGVLGCMAERLKGKLLESDKLVDMVVGPDAYRDLPRLLHAVSSTGTSEVNTQLR